MRNAGYTYRERLGTEAAGVPLADYLAARYAHTPRAEWLARCERGLVLLDGAPTDGRRPARAGQEIAWLRPAWVEPEAPMWSSVVYEDEDLLAVDKPAGLPTLPGAGFLTSSLLYQVRDRVPGASPIHRLGRWTSGLVLFAKSAEARQHLCRQWTERRIGKRYRALASGAPSWKTLTIVNPIGTVPHARLGLLHAVSESGKDARSDVTVLEVRSNSYRSMNPSSSQAGPPTRDKTRRAVLEEESARPASTRQEDPRPHGQDVAERGINYRPGVDSHKEPAKPSLIDESHARGRAFLCDVVIETGRPHQIRIHLAAAGYPLVGDPLYGPGGIPIEGTLALPGDPGYALHAAELQFRHPRTDRLVTISCDPPRILRTPCEETPRMA